MKEFILGDCMEGMRNTPDNFFDLAIVDPPYGLPKDSSNGRGKLKNRTFNKGDIQRWDIAPDKNYFNELMRVSKNQIIWGGNYFDLPPTRGVICWDKVQPFPNFSAWEMAWTSFNVVARIFKFDNRTGGKIHPTQKPVQLYKWLLRNYAEPTDVILSTHIGSASDLIAFEDFGCDYVGYEIDQEYYESALKRLNNHKLQIRLDL